MNPFAMLMEAKWNIADGECESAAKMLSDYEAWRRKGGLEPSVPWTNGRNMKGDAAALVFRRYWAMKFFPTKSK